MLRRSVDIFSRRRYGRFVDIDERRRHARDQVLSSNLPAPHVVTSVHPEMKPSTAIAIVWCRPAPNLFCEAELASGPFGLVVRSIHLEPWELSSGRLRGEDLRTLRFPEILAQAAAQIGELDIYTEAPPTVAAALAVAAKQPATGIKRGREGYGDDHYREVAGHYLRLQAQRGGPRGLRGPLADILGEAKGRPIPEGTVRDWIAEAAKRGFLTSPGRGFSGRQPGPKFTEESK